MNQDGTKNKFKRFMLKIVESQLFKYLVSCILIYLIPIVTLTLIFSNNVAKSKLISMLSVLSSTAATTAATADSFYKKSNISKSKTLVVFTLVFSMTSFVVCWISEYYDINYLNVGFLITFTSLATILVLIIIWICMKDREELYKKAVEETEGSKKILNKVDIEPDYDEKYKINLRGKTDNE